MRTQHAHNTNTHSILCRARDMLMGSIVVGAFFYRSLIRSAFRNSIESRASMSSSWVWLLLEPTNKFFFISFRQNRSFFSLNFLFLFQNLPRTIFLSDDAKNITFFLNKISFYNYFYFIFFNITRAALFEMVLFTVTLCTND